MVLNIFIIFISLGVLMRGVLYSYAKYKGISENNRLSIIKTNDLEEFIEANSLATKAYITLGSILTLFLFISNIAYPIFFREHFAMTILSIFLYDLFVNCLVRFKISYNKQLKILKKRKDTQS